MVPACSSISACIHNSRLQLRLQCNKPPSFFVRVDRTRWRLSLRCGVAFFCGQAAQLRSPAAAIVTCASEHGRGYCRQRRSNRDNATLCSAARGGAKEALQPHLVESAATPSPACVTAAKRYLPECYKNTQMKGAWARRTILQRARDPPPFCRIWRRLAGLGLCPCRTAKDTPNERRRLHCSGTCSLGPEGGRCPHQRRNLQRRRGSSLKARPGIVITHQIGENCITLPYHGALQPCDAHLAGAAALVRAFLGEGGSTVEPPRYPRAPFKVHFC